MLRVSYSGSTPPCHGGDRGPIPLTRSKYKVACPVCVGCRVLEPEEFFKRVYERLFPWGLLNDGREMLADLGEAVLRHADMDRRTELAVENEGDDRPGRMVVRLNAPRAKVGEGVMRFFSDEEALVGDAECDHGRFFPGPDEDEDLADHHEHDKQEVSLPHGRAQHEHCNNDGCPVPSHAFFPKFKLRCFPLYCKRFHSLPSIPKQEVLCPRDNSADNPFWVGASERFYRFSERCSRRAHVIDQDDNASVNGLSVYE